MSRKPAAYEWFRTSADTYPDLLALHAGSVDLTYSELDAAASAAGAEIAGHTRHRASGISHRVGILAARDAATYIAYLGILRTGGTVVPLNTDYPPSRITEIIRLADLDVLVYSASEHDLARALHLGADVRLLPMSGDGSDFTGASGANKVAPSTPDPDEYAYIVFTSGSTGVPKGVPIRHRNFAAWLPHIVNHFTDGPGARVAQTSDLSWDLSVFNMFLAWGSGGAVIVPSQVDLLAPASYIADNEITHWHSTPSSITISRLLGGLTPGAMPSLRWSMFCGEPLTLNHVRDWSTAAPASVITNVYGQTEFTVSSVAYDLSVDSDASPGTGRASFPIGTPHPAVEWAVVTETGCAGAEGELLLRGPQRFDGYLSRTQNRGRFALWDGSSLDVDTDSSILTDAHWYRTGDRVLVENGELYYLGRLDNQVKVRGHRVELGDIETALMKHDEVDEAVVVPYEAAGDGIFDLAGFYSGAPTSEDELGDFLTGQLPIYMIPRLFVHLDRFPLNLNGKIDRRQLIDHVAEVLGGGSTAP